MTNIIIHSYMYISYTQFVVQSYAANLGVVTVIQDNDIKKI